MFLKRFEPHQPEEDGKPNDIYSRHDQRIRRVTHLIKFILGGGLGSVCEHKEKGKKDVQKYQPVVHIRLLNNQNHACHFRVHRVFRRTSIPNGSPMSWTIKFITMKMPNPYRSEPTITFFAGG